VIELEEHPAGIILPIRAHAGARRNAIDGEKAGSLQVSVTQAPEKGKANKAIIALVAKSLGLRKSQIDLISGETSQQKKLLVRDVTVEELSHRVATAIGQA
jgi:uncharacterized protein (TIGR00251 family)